MKMLKTKVKAQKLLDLYENDAKLFESIANKKGYTVEELVEAAQNTVKYKSYMLGYMRADKIEQLYDCRDDLSDAEKKKYVEANYPAFDSFEKIIEGIEPIVLKAKLRRQQHHMASMEREVERGNATHVGGTHFKLTDKGFMEALKKASDEVEKGF